MRNIFLKLLILVTAHNMTAAHTMCETSFLCCYFAHGLRGNSDRYQYPCFQGFFKESIKILSANGPDFIEESISESISHQRISAQSSWWGKFKYRMRRELILLRALRRAVMGQKQDQDNVLNCIKDSKYCTCCTLYIGHSKGAALGAQLLQKHQFAGAILVAPFYDANQAFRDFPPVSYFPRTRFIDNYVVPSLRRFLMPYYDSRGQQPSDFTNKSPNVATQTPILIVSIKGDSKVPQRHQIDLYKKLKETGHDVYFYEIKTGNHDTLAANYPDDHQALVQVVQGFQNYIETKFHHREPVALALEARWYSSPSCEEISTYFAARESLGRL